MCVFAVVVVVDGSSRLVMVFLCGLLVKDVVCLCATHSVRGLFFFFVFCVYV